MGIYTINAEEVVGKIIPQVYISRITLNNNAAFTQGRFQENPHIDPSSQERGTGTAEGDRSRGNGDLVVTLDITVKDIVGEGPGALSKWFSTPNTTLSNGNTLKDYINVYVVLTTNSTAGDAWTQYTYDDSMIDSSTRSPNRGAWNGTRIFTFPLTETFGDPNDAANHYREFDSLGNACRNFTKIIRSDEAGWKGGTGASLLHLTLDSNIQNLACFAWADFDIKRLADDFEFRAAPIQALRTQFASALPKRGKMNSDVIFKNGKLIKTGFVFFEAVMNAGIPSAADAPTPLIRTDKLWVDRVHYHKRSKIQPPTGRAFSYTGWMGGERHFPNSTRKKQPLLIRETVPNKKVQDFRVVERVERLNLSFAKLENKLLRIIDKNPRSVINDAKFSYFTDISLSRDKNDNCRFFFGIDLKKMMRENSLYGGLFANKNWVDTSLTSARIASMKIFRKRVTGSPEIGSKPFNFPSDGRFDPITKLTKFDSALQREQMEFPIPQFPKELSTEPFATGLTSTISLPAPPPQIKRFSYDPSEELIIEAREAYGGTRRLLQFLNTYQPDGKSSIIQVSGIYGSPEGTYFYMGTDGGMSALTDGYYQYRIELEIEDNTSAQLIDERLKLIEVIKLLEEYFTNGSKLGRNGIKETRRGDAHTTEENIYSSKIQEANFDPTTNKFTQQFINNINNGWENGTSGGNGAKTTPKSYIDILQLFIPLTNIDRESIENMLLNYINPTGGNLEGCLMFLKLLRDLMSFLNRAIGVQKEVPVPKQYDENHNPVVNQGEAPTIFASNTLEGQGSSVLKSFEMTHTFDTYYNANLPFKVGYDFLGTGINGIPEFPIGVGLRRLGAMTFQNIIVKNEVEKIFTGPDAGIDLFGLQREGLTVGNSLSYADYSYLTPAIVLNRENPLFMVPDSSNASPVALTDNYISIGLLSAVGAALSTNTKEEKMADFFAYNYNLTAVLDNEPYTPITTPRDPPVATIDAPAGLGALSTIPDPMQDYIDRANDQTSNNKKAFGTFWNLMDNGIEVAGNRGGVEVPEGSTKKSTSFYNTDPTDPNSYYIGLRQLTNTNIQSLINVLPNPVKALLRFNDQTQIPAGSFTAGSPNNPTDPLKSEISTLLQKQPFENADGYTRARLLFETIAEIEVLTGFKKTKYGSEQKKLEDSEQMERGAPAFTINEAQYRSLETVEESLSAPKWQRLTRVIFDNANKKMLLCRLKSWENSIFKIKRVAGQDLPTYEKYFLLITGEADLAADNIRQNPGIPVRPGLDDLTGDEIRTQLTFVTNVRTDYISSTWNAVNITANLQSTPPEPLTGDFQPGAEFLGSISLNPAPAPLDSLEKEASPPGKTIKPKIGGAY